MTAGALIRACLARAERPMDSRELAEALDLLHTTTYRVLGELAYLGLVVCVGCGASGKTGAPRKLWATPERAQSMPAPEPVAERLFQPRDGISRGRRWDYEDDERPSDDEQGVRLIDTRPSPAGFDCSRLQRPVTYAACIDGYTDAMARNARGSLCRGCPIGERHRTNYAEGRGVAS